MRALPAALVALAIAARALLPAEARADEFSEYRIPEHSWVGSSGAFSLNGRRANDSYERYAEDRRSDGGSGYLSAQARGGFDSDRRQYGWGLVAREIGEASHERIRGESGGNYRTQSDARSQEHAQQVDLNPSLRIYPGASPIGFDFTAAMSARWGQGWTRTDQSQRLTGPFAYENLSRTSQQRHQYLYFVRVSGAAGHGLVRDVTVVEDVHLFEQRLQAAGALARPISAAAREKLARLLTATPGIFFAHERPDRFAWREIERVLAEDGALAGGGLDAYSLYRAGEPNVTRILRRRGHFVGVTMGFEHDHRITRSEGQTGWRYTPDAGSPTETQYTTADRIASSRDAAFAGLLVEWHRPVGWAWQWSARGTVTTPIRPGEQGVRTEAQLDGSWRTADRWLAQATLWQSRDYIELGERGDSSPRDSWSVRARAALSWFVEDRTSLFLELSEYQGRAREGYGGPAHSSFLQEARVSAGIGYRFLGRVSAPGLFEPMSLLR